MLNERRFFLSLMPYLLLFVAGTVDAVGFLHLKNGVFASFMSGNSTHMGMMLSYHDYPRAAIYIALLSIFIIGSMSGELIALSGRRFYRGVVMASVSVVLIFAIIMESYLPFLAINFILCYGMGMQNIALRLTIEKSIPLTYATGYLVNIGRLLALAIVGQGDRKRLMQYLCLWGSLISGAMNGGFIMQTIPQYSLFPALALTSFIAVTLFYIEYTHRSTPIDTEL
ncbi:YoaK family protein [uncultured Photobacterium sp.]|uniref:YoaK family protein n=1 Tax=uncultured Photobacterium sp. TaxID=173973 RepID=UPI00260A5BB8|nr:YoaK family protein [uncultured Photobacterium sp.]